MTKGKTLKEIYNSVKHREYIEKATIYKDLIIEELFPVANKGIDILTLDHKKYNDLYKEGSKFESLLKELLKEEDINLKYNSSYQCEYWYVTF